MGIGGNYYGHGKAGFTVWGPLLKELSLKIDRPYSAVIPMSRDRRGYWHLTVDNISAGAAYYYRINGGSDRADPASHFQPDGINGSSQLVDHDSYHWNDGQWRGLSPKELIIYELHVGTFTPEGTFAAIIPRLAELKDIGFNAIELMPVAQFSGDRNWGYDGAFPFAVQNTYGGPDGLKTLVNACHLAGIAVILDVVYNHFGPEGCYVDEFAPFTTAKYTTPWGNAVNFDDAFNDGVRDFFIENARHWFLNYHIDMLRLDAVHSIKDLSACPFLLQLAQETALLSDSIKRRCYLIAESDLNDTRLIRPRDVGGHGLDAQWSDDFHHIIHTLLTGERRGYYQDFGTTAQLAKALKESYVFTGQYSDYRRSPRGNSTEGVSADRFVVYSQNHDQVGNRMRGERLITLAGIESQKLAASIVLLSPYIPLIFMGEEYGEMNPFLYFVSHSDPLLLKAVSLGRKQEFKDFIEEGDFPEPDSNGTFLRSKIDWDKRNSGNHAMLRAYYRRLIELRRTIPALSTPDCRNLSSWPLERDHMVILHRWKDDSGVFCVFSFNDKTVKVPIPLPAGTWDRIIDSSDAQWGGKATSPARDPLTVQPHSCIVYQRKPGE